MSDELIKKQQGARLASARKDAGFSSARSAAEQFGWPYSSYGAHERGTRTIGQDDAIRYAKAFKVRGANVSAKSILFGDDSGFCSVSEDDLPLTSAVDLDLGRSNKGVILEADVRSGAGGGGVRHSEKVTSDHNGNTYAAEGVAGEWTVPSPVMDGVLRASPQHIRVFEVIGDSMEPRLKSGDRVFVDMRLKYPNPEGIFVLWDGYSIVVKKLQIVRGSDPLRLRVISVNPEYEPYEILSDEVNVIGRFVGRFTTE